VGGVLFSGRGDWKEGIHLDKRGISRVRFAKKTGRVSSSSKKKKETLGDTVKKKGLKTKKGGGAKSSLSSKG